MSIDKETMLVIPTDNAILQRRGGRGSRGGSGRGSNRTIKAKPQSEKKKKTLEDYVFKTNQSGEYKETLKYLLKDIRKSIHLVMILPQC